MAWCIQVNVPRDEVPQLCEQLHAIISERNGASFYYPDLVNNTTTCRYEWLRKWRGQKFGLHIGMILHVRNDVLKEISAYVTSNEAIEDNKSELPKFTSNFITRLKHETVQTIHEAIERLKPDSHEARHALRHILQIRKLKQ